MNADLRTRRQAAGVCSAALLVLFQFFGNPVRGYIDTSSLFYWWGFQWWNPASESEHGWLVLGLSAWLFWRNVRIPGFGLRIADRENPPSGMRNLISAAVALVVGLGLHALGFAAQQTRISIVGFLVCTWGVLRLAGGRQWGAAAVFPLSFMLLAIPINVFDSLGFWLRMWVVEASSAIARGAGIGVLQSGTQLLAPDGRYNYDVAAACSGVRSLTAMAALSLLMGYLSFRGLRRRTVVLLLCFPLVYVGNVARIVAIIFAAQLGGPRWGDLAHDVMGYGVFVIVLGGVFAGVSALQRWWPEAGETGDRKPETGDGRQETRDRRQQSGDNRKPVVPLAQSLPSPESLQSLPTPASALRSPVFALAAAVVLLTTAEMFFLHHLATSPRRGRVGVILAADGRNPVELPRFLGTDWIGRRAEVSAVEREILPEDTGYSRKIYVPFSNPLKSVFLSVVLSGQDRTSIHRPEVCLVGQGWTIAGEATHRFAFAGRPGSSFDATLLRVRREVLTPRGREVRPELVAYWFVSGDGVASTHWQRMARDAWNRVVHARADRWAYVLMQTDASDGEAAALARMQQVLDGTVPSFLRVGLGAAPRP